MFASLAATYFLVRALPLEMYGTYGFILSLIGLCGVFTLLGMRNMIIQSVSRGFHGAFLASIPLVLKFSVLGSLVLALGAGFYAYQGQVLLATGLALSALFFPISYGLMVWRPVFIGLEKFFALLLVEGGASIVLSAFVIGAVLLYPGNLLWPLGITLAFLAFRNIGATLFVKRKIIENDKVEEGSVSYGTRTSFYSALNNVSMHIDKFLVFTLLSPEAMAIYLVALKVPEMIKGTIKTLPSALKPRLAKHKTYSAHVDRGLKILAGVISLSLALVTFTVFPFLMTVFFGEQYVTSIPYAQAIMLSLVFANFATFQMAFVRSRLDEKSLKLFSYAMALSRILFCVVFIPLWGLWGAVLAIYAGRITTIVTVFVIMKTKYPVEK